MTQTFNIKRFGLCLKYRLFDPITLRYTLIALAMLAPMIVVSVTLGTMTMAGLMGCGIPMFFGIAMMSNKIMDTLLPATAGEKFWSMVLVSVTIIGLFFGLVMLTGALFVDNSNPIELPKIAVWRLWLSGYAGCAALALIGNLRWMTMNLAVIAVIPGFALVGVNFMPSLLSSGVAWTITLLAVTVALWIGAYAVYKRRQVNNG